MFKSKTFMNVDEVKKDDDQISTYLLPSPLDFVKYLPWACAQHQLDMDVVVTKKIQREIQVEQVTKVKSKTKSKILSVGSLSSQLRDSFKNIHDVDSDTNIVRLTATYDKNNCLVQIKFDKFSEKPRLLMKILKLIAPLYLNLASIVVEPPINTFVAYEVNRIIQLTNVTEVCFDGCYLKDCCYHLLLEGECRLKSLSLARCGINDKVLEMISLNLAYPSPASQSLSILNLASNKITDSGAKYMADALRSNRQLVYLNLSDNTIADEGANEILNSLTEFPLTDKELFHFHERQVKFFKSEMELMDRIRDELKSPNIEKPKKKPKTILPAKGKSGTTEKMKSTSFIPVNNLDEVFIEKARSMTGQILGKFVDPFSDMISKDEVSYSLGNNTLQMLNLGFNDLSYLSLKKLANVLIYQNRLERKPIGLIHVQLNGNRIPNLCKEWFQIEEMLEVAANTVNAISMRSSQVVKKKTRNSFSVKS